MLGGEIDAMKILIEEKQMMLVKKDEELHWRGNKISGLELEVKALSGKIQKLLGAEDDKVGLERMLQKKDEELKAAEDEVRAIKKAHSELKDYWDKKLREGVADVAHLKSQILNLNLTTKSATEERNAAVADLKDLKQKNLVLEKSLRFAEDLRRDQLSRSRQTEYKTLHRMNEMTLELHSVEDDKAQLQETLKLSMFRGNLLEDRLTHAIDNVDKTSMLTETVIGRIESNRDELSMKVKLLTRENEALQIKLHVAQRAIDELVAKASVGPRDRNKDAPSHSTKQSSSHSPSKVNTSLLSPTKLEGADTPGKQKTVILLGSKSQQEGKQALLMKYLKLIVESRRYDQVDLGGLALTDDDLVQVCVCVWCIPCHADRRLTAVVCGQYMLCPAILVIVLHDACELSRSCSLSHSPGRGMVATSALAARAQDRLEAQSAH